MVVTASYCHFCRESLPFYRSLFPIARGRDTYIVAVTPEEPSVNKSYMESNGLAVDAVLSASEVGMAVRATPSLMLLGADGRTVHTWVGKLSQGGQADLIRAVKEAQP